MVFWFKRNEPVDVPDIGTFKYDGNFWITEISVSNTKTELCLAGSKKSIEEFSLNYYREVRHNLDLLWLKLIAYSKEELTKMSAPFQPEESDFKIEYVCIFKENSFDGGHLAIWFNLDCDDQGTYYVSFVNEIPSYFHRDS